MTRFRKFNFNVSLVILCITFPFFKGFAQSEDQSNGAYREVYIKKSWQKLDENKDGKLFEKENIRTWKHLNYLDVNKDNAISKEEFSETKIPYLNARKKTKCIVQSN